ncbi:gamma-glutamyl-gamma-aminobutyrate hydrolase family protein [Bacillus marinisedimentorum]|uniref:gamma-glutamyl-gamma-aminobutyrate hydrolase family protein n=1 Tax=Bacillus marinisedimentorum TaxID=1821260 RepID=UPI000871FF60|nr:gamma-glutamyl-gamma-aminobutyrate hydrolase family protein [Bacillus marinisedimentorum]
MTGCEYEVKPWIGVTVHVDEGRQYDLYPEHPLLYVERDYIRALEHHGMNPVIIPVLNHHDDLPDYLARLDGLLMAGGGYLNLEKKLPSNPKLGQTGKERFSFELSLLQSALKMDMPILGVCRGMQMLNECHGGTLTNLQDSTHHQEIRGIPGHEPTHFIILNKHSRLSAIVGPETVMVNSRHRQIVANVGPGLKAAAWSAGDGVIEAIESEQNAWVFGMQFHPEQIYTREPRWSSLFSDFKKAAESYRSVHI